MIIWFCAFILKQQQRTQREPEAFGSFTRLSLLLRGEGDFCREHPVEQPLVGCDLHLARAVQDCSHHGIVLNGVPHLRQVALLADCGGHGQVDVHRLRRDRLGLRGLAVWRTQRKTERSEAAPGHGCAGSGARLAGSRACGGGRLAGRAPEPHEEAPRALFQLRLRAGRRLLPGLAVDGAAVADLLGAHVELVRQAQRLQARCDRAGGVVAHLRAGYSATAQLEVCHRSTAR